MHAALRPLPSWAASTSPSSDAISAPLELDQAFVTRLRGESQLRLQLGELLHKLFDQGGHHELGFSSIDAYVVERVRESARWGRSTRALAARLSARGLVHLREALLTGRVAWSMTELLSRYATRENEAELVARASGKTVRAMQAELTGGGPGGADASREAPEETQRPTRWLRKHELEMLTLSRILVEHLAGGGSSDEVLMTALLGEAETSLQSIFERDERERGAEAAAGSGTELEAETLEARRRRAERALAEAMKGALSARATEVADEGTPPLQSALETEPGSASEVSSLTELDSKRALSPALPETLGGLDRAIVAAARALARHRVELARLARRVLALRVWRRLGFLGPADYAERHLGLSLSSLEHLATLARRLDRHPPLAAALSRGGLGSGAALLIGRVLDRRATPDLVDAWIERARVRTYKHLREEVNAVLTRLAFEPGASRWPPSPEEFESAAELERQVQSGELFRSLLGSGPGGPQTSVTLQPAVSGLRPVRLQLPTELFRHWQGMEQRFHARFGPGASFVAFMCTSLWATWLPFLEAWDDQWAAVYRRDRRRCASPVCSRRDLTPHHVVFRAHGGGDEPENVVSLCSWCHLQGVHRGRLRVSGRASRLSWRVGQIAVMEVDGRRARFV